MKNRAFTLVELITILALIGVLSVLIILALVKESNLSDPELNEKVQQEKHANFNRHVVVDPDTGCQYILIGSYFISTATQIVPRMKSDGTQLCGE